MQMDAIAHLDLVGRARVVLLDVLRRKLLRGQSGGQNENENRSDEARHAQAPHEDGDRIVVTARIGKFHKRIDGRTIFRDPPYSPSPPGGGGLGWGGGSF